MFWELRRFSPATSLLSACCLSQVNTRWLVLIIFSKALSSLHSRFYRHWGRFLSEPQKTGFSRSPSSPACPILLPGHPSFSPLSVVPIIELADCGAGKAFLQVPTGVSSTLPWVPHRLLTAAFIPSGFHFTRLLGKSALTLQVH